MCTPKCGGFLFHCSSFSPSHTDDLKKLRFHGWCFSPTLLAFLLAFLDEVIELWFVVLALG